MKTCLAFILLILTSSQLSSQILQNDVEQKNSLAIKVGWDQTFAAGINYTRGLNPLFNTTSVNLQFEFLALLQLFICLIMDEFHRDYKLGSTKKGISNYYPISLEPTAGQRM